MANDTTEKAKERITVKGWAAALGPGYGQALKALTGDQVDIIRTALVDERRAAEKVIEWTEFRTKSCETIDHYQGILAKIIAATQGTAP